MAGGARNVRAARSRCNEADPERSVMDDITGQALLVGHRCNEADPERSVMEPQLKKMMVLFNAAMRPIPRDR